ncbi:adipocyte plasma membrane-associated protein isoform X1 [Folsomia candida]|uniref:adipocyte plasma membrane-associated protein isoform X1 n=1 Tax=Folsomia candida TaxID=158441 RepID=UPI000B903848|nr:adipocyte plasma membrane-associated protein isoform X1 [Folsomia candida]
MGIWRPVSFLGRTLIDIVVVTAVILFIPGLPPYVSFEPFSLTPALPFTGKLALNNKLSHAKPLLKDSILGPESIAIRGDELYTGIIGGNVVRYKNGKMDVVTKFGKDCEGQWEETKCGRPLGMRFGPNGRLVVADAYYGLFSVDVDTGKVEMLVSTNDTIDGKQPRNPNDLDIGKDGTIYWSDSSTNVVLQDATIEFFGEPSGRLLKYDPRTKSSTVLMREIHFANGVQLSQNEDFVLVSETAKSRVLRYYLTGTKKGSQDIFIDGLPGSPDNIRSNGKGRIYLSLVAPRYSNKLGIMDKLGPYPLVRKFLLRLMCLVKAILSGIQAVGSIEYVDKAQYWLGHLELAASLFPRHGLVLELDEAGAIISSFQSAEGKVGSISEFSIDDEGKYAYLGSPYNKCIWKVNMLSVKTSQKIPELTLG